ncbi:MAG: hypothetical protein M3R45_04200 [Pseudomonadota bacterium]|nr:hypothetical protein [Pseudomonadota bacterium]
MLRHKLPSEKPGTALLRVPSTHIGVEKQGIAADQAISESVARKKK